jgi:hypothetical protein
VDFYLNLAVAVLLQILRDRKQLKAVAPAIAKVYVKIELAALTSLELQSEIEHQRKKEGIG